MKRPPGITDEQWESTLEYRILESEQAAMERRIEAQGFEVIGFDPADNHFLCDYRTARKVKGRWTHEPCANQALVTLRFCGPDNPKGIDVPLCKNCLGLVAKDLISYLQV